MKNHNLLAILLIALSITFTPSIGRSDAPTPVSRLDALFPEDTRSILEHSQKFTLYSIKRDDMNPNPTAEHLEQYYEVVKSRVLTRGKDRKRIIKALYAGINDPEAASYNCFDPHHAIVAERDGRKVVLLVCFECGSVEMSCGDLRGHAPTTSAPQPAFDAMLK